jgi:hypothetical protein
VRDDEIEELDDLTNTYCEVVVKGGSENLHGKVNILLQTFLSRGRVNSFSLMSDQAYITQVCPISFLTFLVKDTFLISVWGLDIDYAVLCHKSNHTRNNIQIFNFSGYALEASDV